MHRTKRLFPCQQKSYKNCTRTTHKKRSERYLPRTSGVVKVTEHVANSGVGFRFCQVGPELREAEQDDTTRSPVRSPDALR